MASYGIQTAQTYDKYDPSPGPADDGAVVYIHGGAWRSGDKADYAGLSQLIADAVNLPVYCINYNIEQFKGITHGYADCLKAVQFVKADVASERVIAWGDSAGGHLSLLLAAHGEVAAAVAWSPCVNFIPWSWGWDHLADEALCRRAACPAIWRDYSPIYNLTSSSAPTRIASYTTDPFELDYAHAQPFAARAAAIGIECTLTETPGTGHGANTNDIASMAAWVAANT